MSQESEKISIPSENQVPDEKITPDDDTSQNYSAFSLSMKIYLTYLLGIVIILSTLTATIYFPLIPLLSRTYSVSIQSVNLTVTVYAVVQAITPAFFASLADAVGRRPVLLVLITVYGVASLGLFLNKRSYVALITLRALQSVGGSATPPIAYGIVADVALPSDRGSMLGPLLSTCNGISAVGPVIGGALANSTNGPKSVFMALLVVAISCLLAVGFTMPETARNVVGDGSLVTTAPWTTWWRALKLTDKSRNALSNKNVETCVIKKKWKITDTLGSFRMLFYPDSAIVLWMVGTSYSVYYTFQVVIPVIYADIYHYNELKIGLAFLPGLAGMTLGGIIAGKLMNRNFRQVARKMNLDIDAKNKQDLKDFPIEAARYRYFIPFILLQTALVIGYGWAVQSKVHPACPMILQFFVCALAMMLSHPASALLVDIFPDKSSTSYASGQVVRCGLSAACAAIVQPLIDAVGRGWCFTIYGLFVGISGVCCVLASCSKGMQLRQQRYAKNDG